MIPLSIFTFYHDKSKLPPRLFDNFKRLQDHHPQFTCRIFDIPEARQFIQEKFDANTLRAFDRLKPYSFKSDLFRFCYMYIHGGIYIDIKYRCVEGFSLDELIGNEYLVSEPLGIQTCLLVLQPHNKLMKYAIEMISNKISRSLMAIGRSPTSTGPLLLSNGFQKLYTNNDERCIRDSLRWCYTGSYQTIYQSERLILQEYETYRQDLAEYSDQPHYTVLHRTRDVFM